MTRPAWRSNGARSAAAAWAARFGPLIVGLAALAFYLWLTPSVSGDRDSSEFTLVLARNGVAHPSGYPLYTLTGHLFVRLLHALGVGWPRAANAWSATGAAVALFLMSVLAGRVLRPRSGPAPAGNAWLALIPALFLFANPIWAGTAFVAEVYSWHLAWAMGAALLFMAIMERVESPGAAGGRPEVADRDALLWGGMVGTGLAHHLTSVLLAGPLTIVLVLAAWPGRRLRPRQAVVALLALLLPLSADLIIRVRSLHPGPGVWNCLDPTWSGFWRHVTAAQYRGAAFHFGGAWPEADLLRRALFPFLLPALLLQMAAVVRPPRGTGRAPLAGLLAGSLVTTIFALGYGVDDASSYFIPGLALALIGALPHLAAVRASRPRLAAGLGVILALIALACSWFWIGESRRLRRDLIGLDRMLHDMWSSIDVDRGYVLWPGDMSQRLLEYQALRGEKPGLIVLNPWNLLDPGVRRRFMAANGVDPVGEAPLTPEEIRTALPDSPATRRLLLHVARRLNDGTPWPVILFDPLVPEVRRLDKP